VRYQNACRPVRFDLVTQQSQNLSCAIGIQIARRFIRQDQLGTMHECTRDRDPLHFSTGKLARHAMRAIRETYCAQHPQCARARILQRPAQQPQRQLHVPVYGKIRQHVKRLEHEAHLLAAQAGERIVIQRAERYAIDQHITGIRLIQAGNQIE
jgi:hypothetical protein